MRDLITAEYADVEDVSRSLEGVEAYCLRRRDRRGVFVTAYLQITRAVGGELGGQGFHDPEWVGRYLLCFANLYRRALLACETGDTANIPKSWRLAFDAARDGTGLVSQHLLLGINAHINHDLALALGEVGIDPDRPDRYADHTRVNAVLEKATRTLKSEVAAKHAPILKRIDWIAGRVDDDLTKFSIPKARDHAWSFAVALAGARLDGEREVLRRVLDDQAAVLARLILAPPTSHPVLARVVRTAERVDGVLARVFRW